MEKFNILDFPQEILSEIVKRLDSTSQLQVWRTCRTLRSTVRSRAIVQCMALTGTADLLESAGVRDLAQFVSALNLSGVRHLTSCHLQVAIPHFTNLRALDVTYTRVTMWNAAVACAACPHLIDLDVHFDWPNYGEKGDPREMVLRCQRGFRRLVHVRFLADTDEVLKCGHVFQVLQNSEALRTLHVNLLKHDAALSFYHFDCGQPIPPSLRMFSVHVIDEIMLSPYTEHLVFDMFSQWQTVTMNQSDEGIFLEMTDKILQYASREPSVSRCVMPYLPCRVKNLTQIRRFDAWNTELELTNPNLYESIIENIRSHMPQSICILEKQCAPYSWAYCVSPCALPLAEDITDPSAVSGQDSVKVFNLDEIVRPLFTKRISVECWCKCYQQTSKKTEILCFDVQSKSLRNLSYLTIVNCVLDSSFGQLFEVCKGLETIKLVWNKVNSKSDTHERSGFIEVIKKLRLSKSLKYLMLIDVNIRMEILLQYLRSDSLFEVHLRGKADKVMRNEYYLDCIMDCPKLRTMNLHFHTVVNYTHTIWMLKRYLKKSVEGMDTLRVINLTAGYTVGHQKDTRAVPREENIKLFDYLNVF